jgi:HEAT repeat protein
LEGKKKMKTNYVILFAMFCLIIFTSFTSATEPPKKQSNLDAERINENLLEGVKSDNLGLRISCAYYLGEYKVEKAVIPLLKMLHSDKEPVARIQAALSLIKIGNPKGVFMVKQAAKFDESKRVRNLCSKFYNAFQKKLVY